MFYGNVGEWQSLNNAPITYAYKWRIRANAAAAWTYIPGATSINYNEVSTDAGKQIQIEVTGSTTALTAAGQPAVVAYSDPFVVPGASDVPVTYLGDLTGVLALFAGENLGPGFTGSRYSVGTDNRVISWSDQVGAVTPLTQGSNPSGPTFLASDATFNAPSIGFDGLTQHLTTANGTIGSEGSTSWAVHMLMSVAGTQPNTYGALVTVLGDGETFFGGTATLPQPKSFGMLMDEERRLYITHNQQDRGRPGVFMPPDVACAVSLIVVNGKARILVNNTSGPEFDMPTPIGPGRMMLGIATPDGQENSSGYRANLRAKYATVIWTLNAAGGSAKHTALMGRIPTPSGGGTVPVPTNNEYVTSRLAGTQLLIAGEQMSAPAAAPFISTSGGNVVAVQNQMGGNPCGPAVNSGQPVFVPSLTEAGGKPAIRFGGNSFLDSAVDGLSITDKVVIVMNFVRRSPQPRNWWVPLSLYGSGEGSPYYQRGFVVGIEEDINSAQVNHYGRNTQKILMPAVGTVGQMAVVLENDTMRLYVNDSVTPAFVGWDGSINGLANIRFGGSVRREAPYADNDLSFANIDITHLAVSTNTAQHALIRADLGNRVGLNIAGGLTAALSAYTAGGGVLGTGPATGGGTELPDTGGGGGPAPDPNGGGNTPVPYAAFVAPAPTGSEALLAGADFILQNWSASPSVGMARQGMTFKKGQVPAGNSVQIRRGTTVVAAHFDEITRWKDGSLKFCVAHIRDSQFAGNESRTYQKWNVPTPFSNVSTGTLADIQGATNFRVLFTSLTETGNSGTSQVGSGSFNATFNTQAGVPTRVEKYHSGPVCDGWVVWGMARDNNGGAEDAHLKTNWYVDRWKNADGTTYGFEVAAVVAQDWWEKPGKRRRNYNAALVNGTSNIATYNGVNHPYQQRWITCQSAAGNSSGKRFWVGGAQPTLTYKPSKTHWRDTGLVPPLDPNFIPNTFGGTNDLVYVPGSAQNHRADIDGKGAYMGRGVMAHSDGVAFMRQDAFSAAIARVNAHAGLHVYYHAVSSDMRKRPGESTSDVANCVHNLILDIEGRTTPAYNFTQYGMSAPRHAYRDNRQYGENIQGGFQPWEGGGSVWVEQTADVSHGVNYSYFMYLLEGERYHLEAVISYGTHVVQRGLFNDAWSNANVWMSVWPYAQHTGLARYGLTGTIQGWAQERSYGFSLILLGSAAGICPDNHVCKKYLERLNDQQGYYFKGSLDVLPNNLLLSGILPTAPDVLSPWMHAVVVMGAYHNAMVTENEWIKKFAEWIANSVINMSTTAPYGFAAYRGIARAKAGPWHPTDNLNFTDMGWRFLDSPTYHSNLSNSVFTANFDWHYNLTNGDDLIPVTHADNRDNWAIPNGLVNGQKAYVVNRAGSGTSETFQLSNTPGGSPINFNQTMPCLFSAMPISVKVAQTMTLGNGGADDYLPMGAAAVMVAYRNGHPRCSKALADKMTAFIAPIDTSGWTPWDYAI